MASLGISGLYTGLNTDQWVQKLMAADSQRISTQVAKQRSVQARQASWQRIQTSLNSLLTQSDALRQVAAFRPRTVTVADPTVVDATASAGALITSHSLTVTSLAKAQVVSATSTAATADTALGIAGTVTINNKSFDVVDTDTLNTVRSKINALGANVTASVVPVINGSTTTYKMILAANQMGTANAISMSGAPIQNAALQFLDQSTGSWASTPIADAADAVFTLDGSDYTMSTNDIASVIPGVSFTLKKIGSTTVGVAQDADKTVAAVQSWASAYNAVFSQIDTETKVNMKNDTLDTTQSSAPLAGDYSARAIKQSLRSMLSRVVTGLPTTLNQLSQIGVTTGAWGTSDYGKLVVDPAKLKSQMQADPDGVARVFGAITDVNTTGIAQDVYGFLNSELTPVTGPLESQNSMFNTQIKQISDQIARMNDQLTQRQQKLRDQFARMEAAIANMRSQGSAFAAQMGTFGGA